MRRSRIILSAAVSLSLAWPVMAQDMGPGLAGPYLAARSAVIDGNHRIAALYFENALSADPGNPRLIGNAIFSNAALGQWDRAAEIAAMIEDDAPGQELPNLVAMVTGLASGDLVGARSAIEAGQGAGGLIDGLALGWIYLGEGDMRRAAEAFEAVGQDDAMRSIALTQLAYARAAVGDFEGAAEILSGDAAGPITATERTVRAHAEILMQLDRRDDAVQLLDFFTQAVPDPALLSLQDRLAASQEIDPYDFITTPQEGLAEVFYSIARALGAEGGSNTLPLLYTRAAQGIDPSHTEALLFAGQLLVSDGQYELAADAYAAVPSDDDQYIEAQLGRADAYFALDRQDAAVEALQALVESNPDLATVHASLGDVLRRTGDCTGAVAAYTEALNRIDTGQSRYWFLFYARGICFDQVGDFEASEADFRQALILNPDQPQVLNNLGYALVEQRRNLDEALDMIQRAVAGQPDSGYIVDSLGWVLYRLGRYEEAVEPMERAVELLPNDPIINDHLGDVYWMVGRAREAEFQWHRALSFEPEEAEAARIRRKLEVGLTAVIREEGGVGETQ